jgi:hypothetical protein
MSGDQSPSVFDGNVGSWWQKFSECRPFRSKPLILPQKGSVVLLSPWDVFNAGLQVMLPTLSALPSGSIRDMSGDCSPGMTAVLGNKCNDRLIFGIRESAFVSTLA